MTCQFWISHSLPARRGSSTASSVAQRCMVQCLHARRYVPTPPSYQRLRQAIKASLPPSRNRKNIISEDGMVCINQAPKSRGCSCQILRTPAGLSQSHGTLRVLKGNKRIRPWMSRTILFSLLGSHRELWHFFAESEGGSRNVVEVPNWGSRTTHSRLMQMHALICRQFWWVVVNSSD